MRGRRLSILGVLFVGLVLAVLVVPGPGGPSCALSQAPLELTISTLPSGFASFNIGIAVADLINKNSKWLKATHIEGRGPVEHMKTLVTKPEMRKNYLFFNTTWDLWEAKKGIGPYAKFPFNYDEFKFVMLLGIAGNGLCTKDEKIKTLKDLSGYQVFHS